MALQPMAAHAVRAARTAAVAAAPTPPLPLNVAAPRTAEPTAPVSRATTPRQRAAEGGDVLTVHLCQLVRVWRASLELPLQHTCGESRCLCVAALEQLEGRLQREGETYDASVRLCVANAPTSLLQSVVAAARLVSRDGVSTAVVVERLRRAVRSVWMFCVEAHVSARVPVLLLHAISEASERCVETESALEVRELAAYKRREVQSLKTKKKNNNNKRRQRRDKKANTRCVMFSTCVRFRW